MDYVELKHDESNFTCCVKSALICIVSEDYFHLSRDVGSGFV